MRQHGVKDLGLAFRSEHPVSGPFASSSDGNIYIYIYIYIYINSQ